MRSLVLEERGKLALRDVPIEREEVLGPRDVRIKLHTVGICGSDAHYYSHGRIGPFLVEAPMILGHEASGTVVEAGAEVTSLRVGDRVCMEPGVPDPNGRATRIGMYNVDPSVRFWATPPVHGVLRPFVVHPAAFTFKLPPTVSFAEGAMVEPLAVGAVAGDHLLELVPVDLAVVPVASRAVAALVRTVDAPDNALERRRIEEFACLRRRAKEGQMTAVVLGALGQHNDLVEQFRRTVGAVGNDHDDLALVGNGAQVFHQRPCHDAVEAGVRLVEEEQAGVGDVLHGDAQALSLTAAQLRDQ